MLISTYEDLTTFSNSDLCVSEKISNQLEIYNQVHR